MNLKLKKCGIFAAAAAVLLIVALLITTCMEPVDVGGNTYGPAPEGMGMISLNFGNAAGAKTILPSEPASSAIKMYVVEFTSTDTPTNTKTAYLENPGSKVVTLNVGTYTVTVDAYDNFTDNSPLDPTFVGAKKLLTGSYIATGGVLTIVGTETAATTVTIPTTIVADGTEQGIFSWSFGTVPAEIDQISMVISGGGLGSPITISDAQATTSISTLNSSRNYSVAVTYADSTYSAGTAAGFLPRTVTESLHIGGGLTSTHAFTVNPLISNEYNIKLNFNDGRPSNEEIAFSGSPYEFAATLTEPTPPSHASGDGRSFNGWWTTQSTGGKEWNFTSDKVINDHILYARWGAAVPGSSGTFTVDFTFNASDNNASPSIDASITTPFSQETQILTGTPATVTFTVTNASTIAGDSIVWEYNGTPISGETGSSYILDFSTCSTIMKAKGIHMITVKITKDGPPETVWSGSFDYTIVN